MKIAGIDYGSKLAGTTVIAYYDDNQTVTFQISEKKKDADKFLLQCIGELQFTHIFIDAPLSLPGVYTNPQDYTDYFYRAADKTLKGMSPMFLGGLTARAMRLKAQLTTQTIQVFETYPAIHAQRFELKALNYKKQLAHLSAVIDFLQRELPFSFHSNLIKSWHHIDALLAFYAAYRYQHQTVDIVGLAAEGQIFI